MNKKLTKFAIVVVGVPLTSYVYSYWKGFVGGFKKGYNESIQKKKEA